MTVPSPNDVDTLSVRLLCQIASRVQVACIEPQDSTPSLLAGISPIISRSDVLNFLVVVGNSLPETMVDIEFPGRGIVFPIALDDRWNCEALERYMSTTRSKAVYLQGYIDYFAKNDGLQGSATEVLESNLWGPAE